jgi:predicted permease
MSLSIIGYSTAAVAKIVLIAGCGVLLERKGLLSKETQTSLSKLIFNIFSPCLVFVSVGAVDRELILECWLLVLFCLLYTLIAYYIGILISKAFDYDEDVTKVFAASLMFNNAGNLPITLIQSIASDIPPFNADPTAEKRGIAYVGIYMSLVSILLWTGGYSYLNKPPAENTAELPMEETADQSSDDTPRDVQEIPRNNAWDKVKDTVKKVINSRQFAQVFSPAMIAVILSIFVIIIPPLQRLLFSPESKIKFLVDTVDMLANVAIPAAILLLGANLSHGPKSTAQVTNSMISVNVLARLILMAMVGLCVTLIALRLNLLPSDPLFSLVLMMQPAMPTAVNIIVLTQLQPHSAQSAIISPLLFYQYMVCIFTIVLDITIALAILL